MRIQFASGVRRFHADQTGSQGLEKLLIVAAIVLPLLGLLIIFRNEIRDWVTEIWGKAKQDATDQQDQKYFGGKLTP